MVKTNITKEAASLLQQLLYPENECIDCGAHTTQLKDYLCHSCWDDNFKK